MKAEEEERKKRRILTEVVMKCHIRGLTHLQALAHSCSPRNTPFTSNLLHFPIPQHPTIHKAVNPVKSNANTSLCPGHKIALNTSKVFILSQIALVPQVSLLLRLSCHMK